MISAIWGIPLEIAIMWGAAAIFAVCTAIFYLEIIAKEPKNELTQTLFIFLLSMMFSLFLMGSGMYWKNMILVNLGSLSFFLGSAFMLKFPLTVFAPGTRKIVFYGAIIIALLLFAWLALSPSGAQVMMPVVIWLNLGLNGLVTGFFVFFVGLQAKERWLKVKAIGGGAGIMVCCVAAEVAVLTGALLVSAVFQFIAPIILLLSVLAGRKYQQQSGSQQVTNQVTNM